MRTMLLLVLPGLLAAAPLASAQSVPRILQCEDCTAGQMEDVAVSLGQTHAGAFHLFSLDRKQLARYWVDYRHDAGRWIATRVEPQDGIAAMFGHMLDAHAGRPGAFVGRQVFQAPVAAIGAAHDPVAVSIRGRHDSAYGGFIAAAQECLQSPACAAGIDPTLAAMLQAEQRAAEGGVSLWGPQAGMAWEGPPPRLEVRLCSAAEDCASVEYRDAEWTYTGTRSDGGLGKAYPVYGEDAHYSFEDAAAAARFERSLANAGARVRGAWQAGATLSCATVHASADCAYRVQPSR